MNNWKPKEGDEVWYFDIGSGCTPRPIRFIAGSYMEDMHCRGDIQPTKEACQADHDRRVNGCKWKSSGDGFFLSACHEDFLLQDTEYDYCPNCGGRIVVED